MPREYGIDVAVYQPTNLSSYVSHGVKFVFVKATEGTNYINPKAVAQIRSAHANHIYVHAYHFATFGNSVSRAKAEARFFIQRAKYLNISKKRYLALDWETGDGNVVTGSRSANTKAIAAFLTEIKQAGYKPMLYSGASLLRNNVDVSAIVKKFGTCIWVASYLTMGRMDKPNFGYFPSMDGVAIWQFTCNWFGMNVDANISLIDLHKDQVQKTETKVHKQKATIPKVVYAPIINNDPDWKIALRDSNGHLTGKYIPTNSRWKVLGQKVVKGEKYYKIGNNQQWVPAKYVK
ncbi:GH25 family lysozyme [Lactobacillus gigeriorum]|uniref:Lysozyme n=1 Tax=Lactobacillus gigeriorum DSM 23908 = CRBIP 24.85 TaxID=1423751 RepID=I7LD14_9LACO|nr:GH25 family lysozyme [Lactobacillus gigeriorum]KRN12025.1 lytic enzyme lysA [Lactobacillus gigeriorum DSM 23908 = CRBIP 24.85]CCI86956.1 LysA [Lactobacillus gigeriorum DSM 23908 = CRBIP 24.85]